MRLYKAQNVTGQIDDEGYVNTVLSESYEPEDWAEYCHQEWGEYREFFWPTDHKIYRSRSAAQSRVDLINRWGGAAVLLEADVEWIPIEEANRRRERARLAQRIARKQAELEALKSKVEAA
jgi:hypothetical protein